MTDSRAGRVKMLVQWVGAERSTGVTEGYCFRDMSDKENVILGPEYANTTSMHICLK